MYTIGTGKSEKVELGEYEYIPRLKWSPIENKLIVQTLNRHQNELISDYPPSVESFQTLTDPEILYFSGLL